MASFAGQIVDALKAVLETPEGQADALAVITAAETDLTTLITSSVKNIAKPGGLAGAALVALEGAIVNAIVAQIKANPQQVLAWIDADVDAWAKSLGG